MWRRPTSLSTPVSTGLRNTRYEDRLLNSTLSRASRIAKRVTTEEGVEDPQDVFVEETVERLLRLVGLPVPDALHDADLG